MEPKQHLFSLTESYERRLSKNTANRLEGYSDLTELMIIVGKSLVNDRNREMLGIDVPRLKEELILWKYYREGSIDCFLMKNDDKEEEPLVGTGLTSILPLIIGNHDMETLEKELGTFTVLTKQKTDNLVLFLLMGKAVHGVINREYGTVDSFVQFLKEYLIHLNYNRIFQAFSKENIIDKISFEKEKIRWIIDLDQITRIEIPRKKDIEDNNRLLFIQSIHLFVKQRDEQGFYEMIESSEVSLETKVFSLLLMDLLNRNKTSCIDERIPKNNASLEKNRFLEGMDRYFNKLKSFEILKAPINYEKLKNNGYMDTKALFSMKQGEKGRHPILKDFKIQEKKIIKNHLRLEVKTKSRYYILKKPLAPG